MWVKATANPDRRTPKTTAKVESTENRASKISVGRIFNDKDLAIDGGYVMPPNARALDDIPLYVGVQL